MTGLIWTLWVSPDGESMAIRNVRYGTEVTFDRSEASHIAIALAAHEDDDDLREMVSSEWTPVGNWSETA